MTRESYKMPNKHHITNRWHLDRRRSEYCRPPQITLIVPFRADKLGSHRSRIWEWLEEYWSYELPDAEIIVADSKGNPFSKTQAINNAVTRSHGRILVIIDSDCYISGNVIRDCAVAIDEAIRHNKKLWFVPYRHFYRLTKEATHRVLDSDPRTPARFYSPPSEEDVESTLGSMHGHRFGAMIQIMPREAFEEVGCWDNRFRGWGGEDVAFVRACDTLYARHQSTDNDVLHLWHESIGVGFKERAWEGQLSPRANEQLANRYNKATGDRVRMRKLVDEGRADGDEGYKVDKVDEHEEGRWRKSDKDRKEDKSDDHKHWRDKCQWHLWGWYFRKK